MSRIAGRSPAEIKFQVTDTAALRAQKLELLRTGISGFVAATDFILSETITNHAEDAGFLTPSKIKTASVGSTIDLDSELSVYQLNTAVRLGTVAWQPIDPAKTYQSSWRTRIAVDGTNGGLDDGARVPLSNYTGFFVYSSTGRYLGAYGFEQTNADWLASDGWAVVETTATGAAILTEYPQAAYARAAFERVSSDNAVMQISRGDIADVTFSTIAEQFADLAEQSQILSADSATIAAAAQANAQAALALAQVAVAEAEAAEAQALAEAQAAAGSANTAAGQATIATTKADEASGSASAAQASAVFAQSKADDSSNSAAASATSAQSAASEATDAENSASAAQIDRVAAQSARDDAEQEATAAASSAQTAGTHASDAGTFAGAAQTSATNASTSAGNASTSADNAGNSAGSAATSASNAATSASQASTSASNAAGSAATASSSETNAANSETAAGNSAGAASNSASIAATEATNAGNSASTAATSASNAANSENAAGNSAAASSNSASIASTKANEAGTSASAAETSAINAEASNTNAASQASAAASSATSATASAASALASETLSAAFATQAEAEAAARGLTPNPDFSQDSDYGYGGLGLSDDTPNVDQTFHTSFQGESGVWVQDQGARVSPGRSPVIQVQPDRVYRVHGRVWHDNVNQQLYIGVREFDAAGAHVTYRYCAAANVSGFTGWQDFSGDISTAGTASLFNANTSQFKVIAFLNFGNDAADTAISSLWVEDVTESVEAETQAVIASTKAAEATASAASASTSETLAAGYKADAESAKDDAEDAEVNAIAQAAIAASQVALATAEVAKAEEFKNLAATFASGYLNGNANFAVGELGATLSANTHTWQNWTGSAGNKTFVEGDGQNPFAIQVVATAGKNGGFYVNTGTANIHRARVNGGDWHVLECEVELIDGTWRGAGMYMIYRTLANTASGSAIRVSFTGEDVNGVQQGDGTVGDRRKFAILVQAPTDAGVVWPYAMGHFNSFVAASNNPAANNSDTSVANTTKWHYYGIRKATPAEIEQNAVLGPLQASVTTNTSAIATNAAAAASYDVVVAASGSNPALAALTAGIGGSKIGLVADVIALGNVIDGVVVEALRLVNGVAEMDSAIIRRLRVPPRTDSTILMDVELAPIQVLAADGETITYQSGETFGAGEDALPRIVADVSQLPQEDGSRYEWGVTGKTGTSATARLKKIASGTIASHSFGPSTNVGTTPNRVVNKTDATDAFDGNYEFKLDVVATVTTVVIEGITRYDYVAEGDLYVSDGGTMTKVGSYIETWQTYGAAGSASRTITRVLNYSGAIGLESPGFGAHATQGSLTRIVTVSYSGESGGTETAVTTKVPWNIYPPKRN